MKNTIFILVILFILFVACKKDKMKNNNNSGNNTPKTIQLDSFPLTIGHSWKFYTELHLANSAGVIYQNEYYNSYWTVVADTIINGINISKISQLDSNYNGTKHLAFTYYSNQPNGFYGVAVENTGAMFYLKTTSGFTLPDFESFQFQYLKGIDTLFIPDTSLLF